MLKHRRRQRPANCRLQHLTRLRCAIDTAFLILGLEERCSLSRFIDAFTTVHHRPIYLRACVDLPLPLAGICFSERSYDLICYRDRLSAEHRQQIICHQLVHFLYGHAYSPAVSCEGYVNQGSTGTGTIPRQGAEWLCLRTSYDSLKEFEAEYGGTYLASRLTAADTEADQTQATEWPDGPDGVWRRINQVSRLHTHLRGIAPAAYLNLPIRSFGGLDEGEQARLVLGRMLVEITDARLFYYARHQQAAQAPFDPVLAGRDLARPDHATLRLVAEWEARLLRREHCPPHVVPAELSTAPFQSLAYYRLLAIHLA